MKCSRRNVFIGARQADALVPDELRTPEMGVQNRASLRICVARRFGRFGVPALAGRTVIYRVRGNRRSALRCAERFRTSTLGRLTPGLRTFPQIEAPTLNRCVAARPGAVTDKTTFPRLTLTSTCGARPGQIDGFARQGIFSSGSYRSSGSTGLRNRTRPPPQSRMTLPSSSPVRNAGRIPCNRCRLSVPVFS